MSISRRNLLGVAAAALGCGAVGARNQARASDRGVGSEIPALNSFRAGLASKHPPRPTWRQALIARVWASIGRSTVAALNPANSALYNLDYPNRAVWQRRDDGLFTSDQYVVEPWCGAVWDEEGGNFWLPIGGGHNDYGGNEAYRIRLYDDVPVWVMPNAPSGSKPYIDAEGIPAGAIPLGKSYLLDDHKEDSGVYADGRPRAVHSYNKNIYVPGIGPVQVKQGGTFTSVKDSKKWTWRYNERTNEWEFKGTPSHISLSGLSHGGGACYDAGRHCAYWLGNSRATLCRLDLAKWQWTQLNSQQTNHSGSIKLISLPGKDKVLEINRDEIAIWDGVTGDRAVVSTIGAGASPSNGQFGEYGWDWCPSLGCVVCWPGHPGSAAKLYTLTPGTNVATAPWSWGELVVAGGTPPAAIPAGTYGRFAYSLKLNGFMLLSSRTDPVWFFPLD